MDITGQLLGQYRRDLIKQGFTAEMAEHMAVDAARLLISANGLNVSADEVSA